VKKILVALSLLCLVVACGGLKPEASVTGFFDAMKAGDGEKAVSYLSQSTIDEMGSGLEELKADTTGFALGMMTSMLGVEMTAEQLQTMDGKGFAALILGSDMIQQQMGTIEYTLGAVTVTGETATVAITTTMNGQTSEDVVTLVLEDGAWKMNMPEFGCRSPQGRTCGAWAPGNRGPF